MKLLLFTCLATLACTITPAQPSAPPQRRWQPPFDSLHPDVHDPAMAKGEDGRWYIFSTGMGVSVMSSADGREWHLHPPVFQSPPQWAADTVPGYRGHTWAPDVSRHNGQWLLYYSCSTFGKNGSAIGLAVNQTLDPSSPDFCWKDRGMVIASHRHRDNWNAIDPHLAVDRRGNPYLLFGSFWDGIQLLRLSKKDFQTPESKPVTIARRAGRRPTLAEAGGETGFAPEDGSAVEAGENAVEAPFVFFRNGWYYLFVSHGYCCRGERSTYNTVYGRSRKVAGPYLDREGREMAKGGGTRLFGPCAEFFGIGHCGVYDGGGGEAVFVAHGYEKRYGGRAKLFVRKLAFDADGWIEADTGEQRGGSRDK